MQVPGDAHTFYDDVVADLIRVDEPTGCWVWMGPMEKGPILSVRSHESVRRIVWERWREPLPPWRRLSATCSNPRCVNPAHMTHGGMAPAVAAPEPARDRILERAIARLEAMNARDAARGYSSFSDRSPS